MSVIFWLTVTVVVCYALWTEIEHHRTARQQDKQMKDLEDL